MNEKILIYQVLPRLWGGGTGRNVPGGTLQQNGCGKMSHFTPAALERIREFGFTHVWYTGLLEHATCTDYSAHGIAPDHPAVVKGQAGSPYAVKDYYDVCPDLADDVPSRLREFDALVRRTHEAGLGFIMDFVPNHVARCYASDAAPAGTVDLGATDDASLAFSPENNFYYLPGQPLRTDFDTRHVAARPYKEYPAKATGNDCFTAQPSPHDWYETVKLNYGVDYQGGGACHFTPVPDTWQKMTAILSYWAARGVDGFRCDMAEMVPCEFWAYATARIRAQRPGIIFLAEVYQPARYRDYLHRGGFDYLYDKVGLYDTLRAVVCGYTPAASISGCWQSLSDILPHMLYFLENHDEQRIASRYFADGEPRRALPALVVAATMGTGPFMLYAGQELGEPGMDAEGFSGQDGRTSIFDYWSVPSLEKLSRGAQGLTPAEQQLYDRHRRVLRLAREHEAVRSGRFFDLAYANTDRSCGYSPEHHFAYLRSSDDELLLVVANFGRAAASIGVRIPAHAFDFLRLRPGTRSAVDLLTGETQTVTLAPDAHAYVSVPAWDAIVLQL